MFLQSLFIYQKLVINNIKLPNGINNIEEIFVHMIGAITKKTLISSVGEILALQKKLWIKVIREESF